MDQVLGSRPKACKKLTEIPGFSFDVDYVDVMPSTPPTYKKCRQLVDQLEAGLRLPKTRQIQLRKWLWWTGNHPRRYEAPPTIDSPFPKTRTGRAPDIPLSPSERTNLLALKEILDLDKDINLITVVEICRELGEFDAMRSYASKIRGKGEREFASDIIALSDSHGNKFISLMAILPENLRSFIDNSNWIFAETYAKTWPTLIWAALLHHVGPHEYIVRDKVDENKFVEFVRHIRANGYLGKFYTTDITYLDYSNMVYWTMGEPINETAIINRCRKEQSYEYRLAHNDLPNNDN